MAVFSLQQSNVSIQKDRDHALNRLALLIALKALRDCSNSVFMFIIIWFFFSARYSRQGVRNWFNQRGVLL